MCLQMAIMRKLAFRLDGSMIFKVWRVRENAKNRCLGACEKDIEAQALGNRFLPPFGLPETSQNSPQVTEHRSKSALENNAFFQHCANQQRLSGPQEKGPQITASQAFLDPGELSNYHSND